VNHGPKCRGGFRHRLPGDPLAGYDEAFNASAELVNLFRFIDPVQATAEHLSHSVRRDANSDGREAQDAGPTIHAGWQHCHGMRQAPAALHASFGKYRSQVDLVGGKATHDCTQGLQEVGLW